MITHLISDFFRVLLFPHNQKVSDVSRLLNSVFSNSQSAFFDRYELNQELLSEYQIIKDRLHLHASIYTSSTIEDFPEIRQQLNTVFDEVFSARTLGFSKSDSLGYQEILNKLHAEPDEVLFIDDSTDNLTAARTTGIQTIQYFSNPQVISDLKKVFG